MMREPYALALAEARSAAQRPSPPQTFSILPATREPLLTPRDCDNWSCAELKKVEPPAPAGVAERPHSRPETA